MLEARFWNSPLFGKDPHRSSRSLTLPLFVAGIRAHDVNTSSSTNHFAVLANPFHACTDLHRSTSRITWIGSGKADEYKGRGSKSSRAVQPISKKKSRTGFSRQFSMFRLACFHPKRASATPVRSCVDRSKMQRPRKTTYFNIDPSNPPSASTFLSHSLRTSRRPRAHSSNRSARRPKRSEEGCSLSRGSI